MLRAAAVLIVVLVASVAQAQWFPQQPAPGSGQIFRFEPIDPYAELERQHQQQNLDAMRQQQAVDQAFAQEQQEWSTRCQSRGAAHRWGDCVGW